MPRKISVVKPRSFCPECGKKIPFYLNIPVVSYLLLKGKCRYCKKAISPRYPLVELSVGILFLYSYIFFGTTPDTVRISALLFFLFTVSATDADRYIVPVKLTSAGIVFGVLTSFFKNGFVTPLESLAGTAIAIGSVILFNDLFSALFSKTGLGDGDASVAGLIGAYTGWKASYFSLFFGSVFGLVFSLALMVFFRKNGEKDWRDPEPRWKKIPFVPFISAGFLIWTVLSKYLTIDFPF